VKSAQKFNKDARPLVARGCGRVIRVERAQGCGAGVRGCGAGVRECVHMWERGACPRVCGCVRRQLRVTCGHEPEHAEAGT